MNNFILPEIPKGIKFPVKTLAIGLFSSYDIPMETLATYETINTRYHYEIDKIKSSRFIGELAPVKNEQEAKDFLKEMRKKYHDARHHCFAYRIGREPHLNFKQSDDGEPSKTAGFPILHLLNHSNLTDLMIVVIRYYGGTKLGTGGLTRAYTDAARAVLEQAEIISIELRDQLSIQFPYDQTQNVRHLLKSVSYTIDNEQYDNDVIFTLSINQNQIEWFQKNIIEISNGKVTILNIKNEDIALV